MQKISLKRILNFARRKWKNLLVLLLIVGLIPLSLREALKRQDLSSGAAPGDTALTFVPQTQSVGLNQTGFVDVFVNTNGDQASAVQLIVDYDNTVVRVDSVEPGTFFTSQQGTVGAPLIILNNVSNGRITYVISFPLGSNHASSQVATVARINFTKIADGTANFTPVIAGVSRSKVNDVNGVDLLGHFQAGSVSTLASSGARLYFDTLTPANPQTTNSNFTATLRVDTDGKDVSGIDARVTFDPAVIQVQSINEVSGNGFSSYPGLTHNNQTGTLNISANIGTGQNPSPVKGNNIAVATVVFKGIKPAADSQIDFDFTLNSPNDSNIVLFNQQSGSEPVDLLASVTPLAITVQNGSGGTPVPTATAAPTPTPTALPTLPPSGGPQATPTPTPTTGATPTLAPNPTPEPTPNLPRGLLLKLRLQGRAAASANKVRQVAIKYLSTLAGANQLTMNVTTNNSGEALINMVPGSYRLIIDSPGYLARRYGSKVNPITVSSANNELDLTTAPLLGGDFNNDGEINEVDYTLFFLNRFLTSDGLVDLDGSGEVNNLDFSIMRSNWGLVDETFD